MTPAGPTIGSPARPAPRRASAVAYASLLGSYRTIRIIDTTGRELSWFIPTAGDSLTESIEAHGYEVAGPWADPSGTGIWVADVLMPDDIAAHHAHMAAQLALVDDPAAIKAWQDANVNRAAAEMDARYSDAPADGAPADGAPVEWAPAPFPRPTARADWQPATGMPVTVWSDAGEWVGVGTVTDSARRPGAPTLYTIDGHDGVAHWVRTIANLGPMMVHA